MTKPYEPIEKGVRRTPYGKYEGRFYVGDHQYSRTFDTVEEARAWVSRRQVRRPKAIARGIRIMPNGRFQAEYRVKHNGRVSGAAHTFDTLSEAQEWLEKAKAGAIDTRVQQRRMRRDEFIEEFLFLIDARVGWGQILKSLNVTPQSLERRLDRYGRNDLVVLWKNQVCDGGTFERAGADYTVGQRHMAITQRDMSLVAA